MLHSNYMYYYTLTDTPDPFPKVYHAVATPDPETCMLVNSILGRNDYFCLTCSVVEDHQTRVERKGPEHMRADHHRHRRDRSETFDLPSVRSEVAQVDHPADQWDHQQIHPLEALEDLGQLLEEIGVILLLSGGTPVHVDTEHMGQKSHTEME
jgi:hypothetical protein